MVDKNRKNISRNNNTGNAPILKAREVSDKFTSEERKSFAQEVKERFCPAFEKLARE